METVLVLINVNKRLFLFFFLLRDLFYLFYPVLYGDEFLAFPEAGFPVALENVADYFFDGFGYDQFLFRMFGGSFIAPEFLTVQCNGQIDFFP